jgi:uncharacterized protein
LEIHDDRLCGQELELALLQKRLAGIAASGTGTALVIRGRRQVGRSRLTQEFCDRAGVPYLFYAATKGASPVEAIADFLAELSNSTLPRDRNLVPAEPTASWADAFRVLAAVLPDSPAGRADNLLLGPLNPAEVGGALDLPAADAIDAYLLSGGLPGILRAWPAGVPALEFAERECADPASPLFGVPEAALLAEFPAPDVTRRVIEAVGGGNRTHANIAAEAGSRAGAVPSGTLTPVLHRLVEDKHVLAIDEPLSVRPTKPALYRVADTSLRFYLGIGRAAHELSRRGRAAAAGTLISRRWASWRGRAVEPVIRAALSLAAVDLRWPEATAVGGWWNRAFDPEIDLIGADRAPVATRICYAGSVRWLDHPFGSGDLAALERGAAQVPGFDRGESALIGVSRTGFSEAAAASLALTWLPEDVVGAFA